MQSGLDRAGLMMCWISVRLVEAAVRAGPGWADDVLDFCEAGGSCQVVTETVGGGGGILVAVRGD